MGKSNKIFLIFLIFLIILCIISCSAPGRNNESTVITETGETTDNIVLENPRAVIISGIKITGQAIDLKVSGDYLYITNDLGYLYIVDINDKSNPSVVGKCSGIDAANIVFIEDGYAYISYSKYDYKSEDLKVDYGFKIVDIRNKEKPVVVGNWGAQSLKVDKSVHGLFIKDNLALVTLAAIDSDKITGTFQAVDLQDKAKPVSLGSISFDGSPNAVWADGDYACINLIAYDTEPASTGQGAGERQGKSFLKVIDIKDRGKPFVSGSCEVPFVSWGLYSDKDFVYLTSNNYDSKTRKYYDSSMQIVDIKDKKAPKMAGRASITGGAWELDFKDNYMFVSNLDGGFDILDISDRQNPAIIDSVKTKGATYDVEVSGGYCYLADGFEGLKIFKLEPSAEPSAGPADTLQNSKPVADMEISGDELEYSQSSGINTFSTENPVYFSGLGSYDIDGDDINYSWEISGQDFIESATPSKDRLSIIFNKAGEYDITLKVSDGNFEDKVKKTVRITGSPLPVKIIKNHEFTVEIMTTITNNSMLTLNDLECFTKAPQNDLPFQEILGMESNSVSEEVFFDNDFNKIMHFKFDNLEPGKSFTATMKCKVMMPELSVEIPGSADASYAEDDPDLKLYTTEDLFIDSDNTIIINAAKSAAGKSTDPVEISRKLYNFVTKKLDYDFERAKDKDYDFYYASKILTLNKGICADYAILYTALLRAMKIPARIAAGVPVEAVLTDADNIVDFGHAWVEIKLPGYGWVPFDVTSEDSFLPRELYLNLAIEKGSSFLHRSVTMDWASYFFEGFNYSWEGTGKPDIKQDLYYKVYGLKESDMDIYNW